MAVFVAIPKILRERLTDEGADALVSLLNESEEKNKQDIIALVEEKFERRLAEVKTEIITTLLKWMVTLWITQMAAILALFFRK